MRCLILLLVGLASLNISNIRAFDNLVCYQQSGGLRCCDPTFIPDCGRGVEVQRIPMSSSIPVSSNTETRHLVSSHVSLPGFHDVSPLPQSMGSIPLNGAASLGAPPISIPSQALAPRIQASFSTSGKFDYSINISSLGETPSEQLAKAKETAKKMEADYIATRKEMDKDSKFYRWAMNEVKFNFDIARSNYQNITPREYNFEALHAMQQEAITLYGLTQSASTKSVHERSQILQKVSEFLKRKNRLWRQYDWGFFADDLDVGRICTKGRLDEVRQHTFAAFRLQVFQEDAALQNRYKQMREFKKALENELREHWQELQQEEQLINTFKTHSEQLAAFVEDNQWVKHASKAQSPQTKDLHSECLCLIDQTAEFMAKPLSERVEILGNVKEFLKKKKGHRKSVSRQQAKDIEVLADFWDEKQWILIEAMRGSEQSSKTIGEKIISSVIPDAQASPALLVPPSQAVIAATIVAGGALLQKGLEGSLSRDTVGDDDSVFLSKSSSSSDAKGTEKRKTDEEKRAEKLGKPTREEGYISPKRKGPNRKVKIDGTNQTGWEDEKGNVWVKDDRGHGGNHWDVQSKDGKKHTNVYPGGKKRS